MSNEMSEREYIANYCNGHDAVSLDVIEFEFAEDTTLDLIGFDPAKFQVEQIGLGHQAVLLFNEIRFPYQLKDIAAGPVFLRLAQLGELLSGDFSRLGENIGYVASSTNAFLLRAVKL